jgi:hypothetical protein
MSLVTLRSALAVTLLERGIGVREIPIALWKMINLQQESAKTQQKVKVTVTNRLINTMRLISRRIGGLSLALP